MRNLIFLIVLFAGCSQMVEIDIYTENRYIEDEDFKISDGSSIIEIGKLPLSVTVEEGSTITAEFEANVSNFGINHPECNCIEIVSSKYQCKEKYTVKDVNWEIAKGEK